MSIELILLIAALIVSWLAFTAAIKILKTTLSTAIAIFAIVLILQLGFGVQPQVLLQQITQLPQVVRDLLSRN